MKKNFLALLLCVVMLVSVALVATGCKDSTGSTEPAVTTASEAAAQETSAPETAADETKPAATGSVTVLGEGKTVFTFTVTDLDGKNTTFEIHTDKATVGEALLELGLIAGENSDHGLYVKTVNGLTLDYNKDGKYWAFYENGEYAQNGVDSTNVVSGASYSFKAE